MSEVTLKHLIDEDHKSINLNTVILIAEGFGMSLKEFFDDDLFNPENLEADWTIIIIRAFHWKECPFLCTYTYLLNKKKKNFALIRYKIKDFVV